MAVAKFALALALAASAPAFCQAQGAAGDPAHAPALVPLGVGPLHIASDPSLDVAKIVVEVSVDAVSATYFFDVKGPVALDLAASFAIPGLQAEAADGAPWNLPGATPQNPISLAINANGAPVAARIDVRAVALGVDRRAEIEAAHLPLAPFAPGVAAAIARLSPAARAGLAALGVLSPDDPAHADRQAVADWTLEVVHSWRQRLEPGRTNVVSVKYSPLKAQARYAAADALDLEDLKEEACLTPAALGAAQAALRAPGAALAATEIALVNEPPMRWFDSPAAEILVRKPRPEAIVAFCGMDAKTAGAPVVRGAEIGGADPRDFRILILEPIKP